MAKENLQKAWQEKVNQFKASGKTQAIWCKEQGINVRTFNYYDKQSIHKSLPLSPTQNCP